jgi:nucleotide-binding universal stress UspA family protein
VRAELEDDAGVALERARRCSLREPARALLRTSLPQRELIRETEFLAATLVAVGAYGQGRSAETPLGEVLPGLLRGALCSVFAARQPRSGKDFPGSVVVAR